MKIISVNVGIPHHVSFNNRMVRTAIFKEPVKGRLKLRKLNLEGDEQADLTVHGGADKAVYSYPAEHYKYWQHRLPKTKLRWGNFGENFTTDGLLEDTVNIGDRFQVGTAQLMATQPRMPCYKLGIRFGRMDMVKMFGASLRPGIYFRVMQEGEVGVGDSIKLISVDKSEVKVRDIIRLYDEEDPDIEELKKAASIPALPEHWRNQFYRRLGVIPGTVY